jgi:hypothetical protein
MISTVDFQEFRIDFQDVRRHFQKNRIVFKGSTQCLPRVDLGLIRGRPRLDPRSTVV